MKTPRFKFGDWVIVTNGFYRGQRSEVRYCIRKDYGLRIIHNLEWINEDDMELCDKPWWVLW